MKPESLMEYIEVYGISVLANFNKEQWKLNDPVWGCKTRVTLATLEEHLKHCFKFKLNPF